MQPKVAIIIPTANRADLLSRAINSALAQDYSNIQVIVIDDASNDGTRNILEKYDRVSNLSYILLEPPVSGTASTGRNLGLALTDAEYVSFLDADDELDSRKIRIQFSRMCEDEAKLTPFPRSMRNLSAYPPHQKIDVCFSQMYFITAQNERSVKGNILDLFYATHPNIILPNIEHLSITNLTTGLFHKDVFNMLGGFKMIRLGEDSEFKERIISFGCNVSFVYEPLYLYYRGAPNSLMLTRDRSDSEENQIRKERLFDELAKTKYEMKFCSSKEEYIQKFSEVVKLDSIKISKIHNKEALSLNNDLRMTDKTKLLLKQALALY